MPTRSLVISNGNYYHVLNRGVNKGDIYLLDEDYAHFVELLGYYRFANLALRYSHINRIPNNEKCRLLKALPVKYQLRVQVVAYGLMPNHFHLVLKQELTDGIMSFLRDIQDSHTRYINRKHQRIGPLYQGRFKAVSIESDEQLIHVVRYTHLNPNTAGLTHSFEELLRYPWTSLQEYLEIYQGFCDQSLFKVLVGSTENIRKFHANQTDYQRQLALIKHLILEE